MCDAFAHLVINIQLLHNYNIVDTHIKYLKEEWDIVFIAQSNNSKKSQRVIIYITLH